MNKISIVIPSYNRGNYIIETLKSVVNQTSSEWECLIVDDGSTDATEKLVKNFMEQYPEFPFQWMTNQRAKGAQGARNTGILNSTGDYLLFLDSDDLLDVHCIENRLQTALRHPEAHYFAFPVRLFHEVPGDSDLVWNKMHKKHWNVLDRFLLHDAPWQTLGCLWSRHAITEIGLWDEQVSSLQDWDVHIQAVIHPKLKGWLCSDELAFDAYYRVGSYDSVSKKFSSPQGAVTNVHLVQKTYIALKQYDLFEVHKPGFRRFLWIMNTLVSIGDNSLGRKLYAQYGEVYDLNRIQKKAYDFYFKTRFNMSKPKLMRGVASLVPKLVPLTNMPERQDTCMKLSIKELN